MPLLQCAMNGLEGLLSEHLLEGRHVPLNRLLGGRAGSGRAGAAVLPAPVPPMVVLLALVVVVLALGRP